MWSKILDIVYILLIKVCLKLLLVVSLSDLFIKIQYAALRKSLRTFFVSLHIYVCIYVCEYILPLFVTLKKVYDRNVMNKYRIYLLLISNLIDYISICTNAERFILYVYTYVHICIYTYFNCYSSTFTILSTLYSLNSFVVTTIYIYIY